MAQRIVCNENWGRLCKRRNIGALELNRRIQSVEVYGGAMGRVLMGPNQSLIP